MSYYPKINIFVLLVSVKIIQIFLMDNCHVVVK